MKLCGECRKTLLPYLMAAFISAFIAFLTWFMLAFTGLPLEAKRWWTVGSFLGVFGLLLSYLFSCLRRHCSHDGHHKHHHHTPG